MAIALKDKFNDTAGTSIGGHTPDVGAAWADYDQAAISTGVEDALLDGSGAVVASTPTGIIVFSSTSIGNDDYHVVARGVNVGPFSEQWAPVVDAGQAAGSSSGYLGPAQEETTNYFRRMAPGSNPPGTVGTETETSPGPGDYVVHTKIYTSGSNRVTEYCINGALVHTRTDASPLPITRNVGLWLHGDSGEVKVFGLYAQSSINSISVTHDYDGESIPLGADVDITITGIDTAYDTISPVLPSHWGAHDGGAGFAINSITVNSETEIVLNVTPPDADGTVTIVDPTTLENIVLTFGGAPELEPGTISAGTVGSTQYSATGTAATGDGTITYQWHESLTPAFTPDASNDIVGATSQNLPTQTGKTPAEDYYLIRVATDDNGSENSNELHITTGAALAAGTIPALTMGTTTADVNAPASTGGATPYTYQWERRSPAGSGSYADVVTETAEDLSDTGLSSSTEYEYRRTTTDAEGTTVTSNAVSGTTGAAGALVGGVIAEGTVGETTATFTSSAAASGGTAPYTYQWYRKTGAGSYSAISGATATTLSDSGLTASTSYTYKRTATDAVAAAADSNEVTITTDDPAPVSTTKITAIYTAGVETLKGTIVNQNSEVWDGSAFIAPAAGLHTYAIDLIEDEAAGGFSVVGPSGTPVDGGLYAADMPGVIAAGLYTILYFEGSTFKNSAPLDLRSFAGGGDSAWTSGQVTTVMSRLDVAVSSRATPANVSAVQTAILAGLDLAFESIEDWEEEDGVITTAAGKVLTVTRDSNGQITSIARA